MSELEYVHGVRIHDEALSVVDDLSNRFPAGSVRAPHSAYMLLDETCAYIHMGLRFKPKALDEWSSRRAQLQVELEQLSSSALDEEEFRSQASRAVDASEGAKAGSGKGNGKSKGNGSSNGISNAATLDRDRDRDEKTKLVKSQQNPQITKIALTLKELDKKINEMEARYVKEKQQYAKGMRLRFLYYEARKMLHDAIQEGDNKSRKQASKRQLELAREITKLDDERTFDFVDDRLTPERVAEMISKRNNVPLSRLTSKQADRILSLHKTLKARVVGQNEAVDVISDCMIRSAAQITRRTAPMG